MKFFKIAAATALVTLTATVSAQAGPNDPPYTKRVYIADGLCSDMVVDIKRWALGADEWAAFATPTVPTGTPRCGPNRNKSIDVTVVGASTRLGAIIHAKSACNRKRPAGMGTCRVVGVVRNY